MKDFGKFLGIAFQIIDDTLDYFSEKNTSGKELGNDFREHKITLPLILVFKRSNKKEKNFLEFLIKKKKLNNSDLQWVIEKMNNYNVLEDCLQKARHFSIMAKDSLGCFNNSYEKEKLQMLVDLLIDRNV